MGIFKMIENTGGGTDYLKRAVNYITNKNSYSPVGSPNVDVDDAYYQIVCVKKYFEKTSGNPLFHFILIHNSRKVYDENQAIRISERIAEYFKDKYQVIWSVHYEPRKAKGKYNGTLYHTHLVINSVSYVDGKMFTGNRQDTYKFLEHVKQVTRDKMWIMEFE